LTRLIQGRLSVSRARAGMYAGVLVWLGSLLGLLSFGVPGVSWRELHLFGWLLRAVTNVILPTVGLAYCLFLGRVLARQRLMNAWETAPGHRRYAGFRLWYGSLRYPTRVVLALVLFYSLGGLALITWLWGS